MLDPLLSLTVIIAVGVGAQWIAWRVGIPSILILLLAGFIVGPVTGAVRPNELAGPLLMPAVSIAVALILFEGGLSLRFSEVKDTMGVVWILVTAGAAVTMVGVVKSSFVMSRRRITSPDVKSETRVVPSIEIDTSL